MFEGGFKRGSRKFQEIFIEISWVCKECFRGISREFHVFEVVKRPFCF